MFGPVPLPGQFQEFRPQQWKAMVEAKESLDSGDDVAFIGAPTGSGKSLIGEGLRRLLHANGLYVCTTKLLQDQFAGDFPYGQVIKGRSNYLTELGNVNEFGNPHDKPWSAITCADCTYDPKTDECSWCRYYSTCPYVVAKKSAVNAPLAITNTSYMLTDFRFQKMFKDRGVVIIDEADLLEQELLSQIEVVISPERMKELGLKPPKFRTKSESWQQWIYSQALPAIRGQMEFMPKPWEEGTTPRQAREFKGWLELRKKLAYVNNEIGQAKWVYDGEDLEVIFRPVRVDKWGIQMLWPHAKKFILMSATILSADLMADELGLYLPYSSIEVESTFPVENRPIYVCPVADMSFKNKELGWQQMVQGVDAVLDRHQGQRGVIHTVSYGLARYLHENLADKHDRPMLFYDSSKAKSGVLSEYLRRKGSVIFAASMDRGIDLKDEAGRFQVLAKTPFADHHNDRRTRERMNQPGGAIWYRMMAIRAVIQAIGRIVRHDQDWGATYILDSQFTNNLWKSDYLFPDYVKEAMVWNLTAKQLLKGRQ